MQEQGEDPKASGQSAPKQLSLRNLSVFKDQPLFAGVLDEEETDAFDHAAFANTMLDLIKRNDPPLSIGLFGGWGIGKSTIINILFRKLREHESPTFKPIYFNAWKYSGDSFRRQFLIETARQVYGKEHSEVSRLTQLNYVDVLKPEHQKGLAEALVRAIRETFKLRFALRSSAIWRFMLGCSSLLILAGIAGLTFGHHPLIATLLLTTIAPAVFVWFSQIKFEDLFVFQEAPLYDPKLIFPEQFETEFASLIKSDPLKGKKAVIAIDDLDRCEPRMVQDVLISMKNFIGQEECFFIIPCDDKTVVAVFNEANQKQGYSDESLRKYFNVVLRIPPITSTDLVDFANTMARKTGIPEDVIQVAVLANCRDARKMKHFLNSLAMKYQIAKAREAAGLMPTIVDESLLELAKAVLIEDAYPALFSKIVENPRVYHVLEQAALGNGDETVELKSLKLENWNDDYAGLREILELTRDIPMVHADVFFSLKSTNPEVKVPRGTELKTAIISGTLTAVDEIAKEITEATARTALADLLVDLLIKSTGKFLQHSISAALKLYAINLFSETDRKRVATYVTSAILHRDKAAVLSQPPDVVLNSAEEVGNPRLREMLDRYYLAISELKTPAPPRNILLVIGNIYRYPDQRPRFAALLNEKFYKWVDTQDGLTALENINLPADTTSQHRIPSKNVVARILETITPEASEMSNNEIRRNILFSNWSDEYAGPFLRTLAVLLQRNPPGVNNADIRFAVESVNLKKDLAAYPDASAVWGTLPNLYERTSDSQSKTDVAEAALAFAAFTKDANVRNASKNFLLAYWRTLSDPFLRKNLALVGSLVSPEAPDLIRSAIQQELATANQERQSPTERTSQRVATCLDFSEHLNASAVADLLFGSLDLIPNEPLERWVQMIRACQDRLDEAFALRIANRCVELVRAGNYDQARAQILLRAMTNSIPSISPEKRTELIASYFALLKNPNPNTRNAAASELTAFSSAISDQQELRIRMTNMLGDLKREIATNDLLSHRPTIDAILIQKEIFGESAWDEVGGLSKRLLPEANPQFQELGISLVEHMPVIPGSIKGELAHLLEKVEASSTLLRERASRLREKLAPAGSDSSAESTENNIDGAHE